MSTQLEQFINKRPPVRLVAGGIIFNETLTEVLIVKGGKSRKWGLAKGGIKKGESYIEASLREIHEETGIKIKLLADTLPFVCIDTAKLYIYVLPKRLCQLNPMDKDEIIDIKWIDLRSLPILEGKTKLLSIVARRIWDYAEKVKQYKRIYQPIMINYGGNRYIKHDLFNQNNIPTTSTPPKLEFILNKYLADKITTYIKADYNLNEIIGKITNEFPKLLNMGDICLSATKLIQKMRQVQQHQQQQQQQSWRTPKLYVSPILSQNQNTIPAISA